MRTQRANLAHRFGLTYLPTPAFETHAGDPSFFSQKAISDSNLTSSTSSRRPFSYLDADVDDVKNGLASRWNYLPSVNGYRSATGWIENSGLDRGPSPAFPTYPISSPKFPTNMDLNSNPYTLQGMDQFNRGIDTVMTLPGPQESPASAQPWMLKEPLASSSSISTTDQIIDPNLLQRMDQVYSPVSTHAGVNTFVQPFSSNARNLDQTLHAEMTAAEVYDFRPAPVVEANNDKPIKFDSGLTDLEDMEECERFLAQTPDGNADTGWEGNF